MRWARILPVLATWAMALPASSHEVRPAYLEIAQTGPGSYTASWKQPTLGPVAIHLVPHLSNGWLERPPSDQFASAGFLVKTWKITTTAQAPLDGRGVEIEGLRDTITDVLLRVRLRGGQGLEALLRPESPSLKLSFTNGPSMSPLAFLLLGVEHILTGPDHLLFVLGLLLLVGDRWMLLKTISAFTFAHSITLAAASFGLVNVPAALSNTLVALSILCLAPEILRAQRGGTSLTIRHPWVVAFGFGLLHGIGFAGGLKSLGLEGSALYGPLVMFNLGVEAGQLAFIALVLALRRAFRLMAIVWPRPIALSPIYAVGVLGAMWTFQYGVLAFAGAA